MATKLSDSVKISALPAPICKLIVTYKEGKLSREEAQRLLIPLIKKKGELRSLLIPVYNWISIN